jgi:F-type H+/Na+-transporting ATPase subunit beta
MAAQTKNSTGRIVEIKGVVLDVVFPDGLPQINHALKIQAPNPDGEGTIELIAEVQQHLGDDRVRAVTMECRSATRRSAVSGT